MHGNRSLRSPYQHSNDTIPTVLRNPRMMSCSVVKKGRGSSALKQYGVGNVTYAVVVLGKRSAEASVVERPASLHHVSLLHYLVPASESWIHANESRFLLPPTKTVPYIYGKRSKAYNFLVEFEITCPWLLINCKLFSIRIGEEIQRLDKGLSAPMYPKRVFLTHAEAAPVSV